MHYQVFVPIDDASQIGEARRAAVQVANLARFDDTALGKLAIVVTELASNIIKHAKRGEILIGNMRGAQSVDVIALDSGPGMGSLERSWKMGFLRLGQLVRVWERLRARVPPWRSIPVPRREPWL